MLKGKALRDEVKSQGLTRYFSPTPCIRGHVGMRKASTGNCIRCIEEWRERNPGRVRAAHKAYREKYPDKVAAIKRASMAKQADKYRLYWRDWQRRNVDKVKVRESKRRAAKAGSCGTHTIADLREIKRWQLGRCAYQTYNFPWCVNFPKRGHWDHRVPLARGGSNSRQNMQWLCGACNARKGAFTESEFLRKNGVNSLLCLAA